MKSTMGTPVNNKENLQKEAVFKILSVINNSGFRIMPYEENGVECGFEIEDWTPNGVDMCHLVDLRGTDAHNPFNISREMWSLAYDFDPDEEVEIFMENEQFRNAFTYKKAAEEFENWEFRLKQLASIVEETLEQFVRQGLSEWGCTDTEFSVAEWASNYQ